MSPQALNQSSSLALGLFMNKFKNLIFATLELILLSVIVLSTANAAEEYELVIANGRVIDPETKLDAIRNIGINQGEIVEISTAELEGSKLIDASNLVVAPGFIDLHTHSPTQLGQYYQLFDGVTTALELEWGGYPVNEYGQNVADQPLINFGATSAYNSLRMLVKDGIAWPDVSRSPSPANLKGLYTAAKVFIQGRDKALQATFTEVANDSELDELREKLELDIDSGSLGIGMPLDYVSQAIQSTELAMVFEVAANKGVPIFIHVRRGIDGDPSGLLEAINLAKTTGASIHVCHISHNAMSNIDLFLDMIDQARQQGVDVTTEVLPFNAGSAAISSAVFDRDWQTIFNISYEDIEWAATGERLTKETFHHYKETQPMGFVIHHYLQEAWTESAIKRPGVIIVSDLLPMQSKDKHVAPHNSAFTKILAEYVREKPVLTLMQAIEKMSLLPAQRLQKMAPVFAKKGRIQKGANADIVIFDPNTINNNASYADPYQEASGFAHILVNGIHLVENGKLQDGKFPGKRMLRTN